MKVNLSIINRVSFLGLLTNKGDFTTLKILRELREELGFTEEEHKVLNIRPIMGGKIQFDEKAVPPKEYEFEEGSVREVLLQEVKTQLRDQEKAKTLQLDYLDLYEVLFEGKDQEENEIAKAKAKA